MEKQGSCTVIVNPTAGHERAPRYVPLLQSVLEKRFEKVTIRYTEKAGDATDFAREAALQNEDVICMGGDGTINEVINGMVPVESESTFGFIPFGTVNDLARALHIPRSPKGAIRMLESAKKSRIDVGRINDRYFINVVAAGLISEAVSEVSIKQKTLFGSLAYFMKAFTVLNKQKSYHFKIEEENGTVIQISSPLMAAMLTDSAGSFRNLIPPEDRNKGVIKLCLFHDFEWIYMLRQAPKLLSGMQMGSDFVTVVTFKKAHVSITEEETIGTNVDGDKGPNFPIDLEILPGRLPVFVPDHADDTAVHFPRFFDAVAPHIHFPWNEHEKDYPAETHEAQESADNAQNAQEPADTSKEKKPSLKGESSSLSGEEKK